MKKRIHPYFEPRLIIHTNGSTYLNGPAAPFPLRSLRPRVQTGASGTEAVIGEESLLCLRSKEEDHKPSKQDSSPLRAAKEKIQKCLFSSYLIKYLSPRASGPEVSTKGSQAKAPLRSLRSGFEKGSEVIKMSDEAAPSITARVPTAELRPALPAHKKVCLVLDTDTVTNPL